MKYDFTTILQRQDAIAAEHIPLPNVTVREGFSRIPMWVADMSFAVPPSIQEAVIRRTEHPTFGYFAPSEDYYSAILSWQRERNGAEGLTREHLGYANGVLGGVISAMNVLCSRGDNVLLHSPTYIGFTEVLENNGYNMVHSPLRRDERGVWRMDLADMERRIAEKKIHTAILSSPHNPTGRVWERWELEEAMALFEKYDVWVISDEIWSDLLLDGHKHTPTQSVSSYARQHTAAFYAPSKTFNLAGLVGSYSIIYDRWLRERVAKEASLSGFNSMNVLSMHALVGAYSPEGAAWLAELREVLSENVRWACGYIEARFKGVETSRPQGTYMLFLDCAGWLEDHGKSLDELLRAGAEAGVLWQDGRDFEGPTHIRLNLALPKSRLEEAFERLDRFVFNG
ncbi:MAG: aminotransferase class I/II-fold pyridoxal phosphate-dependent enzyme [Oscillospiraceae bacterium]|nr:aminotransferase class I/II-fold pyridoxal phosphate-dependent enzyme [Oscillospiraceae bacterium]MCI8877668.1 aminotransferase class I/II-fold pyridoxal phosphate-dependent enzyme [Oscillospiraceae bacterium]